MDLLAQYARSTYGAAFIWCGFAILVAAATKPVWSQMVFGYEPTLDDLLSLRYFGLWGCISARKVNGNVERHCRQGCGAFNRAGTRAPLET